MAREMKSGFLFFLISIVSLAICVFSIVIGELYFRGTEFVDIYCLIGLIFMMLFLINFGVAEFLLKSWLLES